MLFHSELGANPLTNSGIEMGAFDGALTLYIGMAEAKLSAIPKGKNMPSYSELTISTTIFPVTSSHSQMF